MFECCKSEWDLWSIGLRDNIAKATAYYCLMSEVVVSLVDYCSDIFCDDRVCGDVHFDVEGAPCVCVL